MFDFDRPIERRGTDSVKWNEFGGFRPHPDMLPFWIADTDFGTVPEAVQALKARMEHPIFGYDGIKPSTYEAIQGWWERRYGWRPETDWMFFTTSVVSAIYFSIEAFTEPGDRVLTLTPAYDPFFAAVENTKRTLVACPLDRADGYYTIDWGRLEAEFRAGVKALIFCNPHNPIARVWTREELQRLTDLCAGYGVWIFSDEVHADYGLERRYTPVGVFESVRDRLVVCTAISKTFNMAGLGSACIMVPNEQARTKLRREFSIRSLFGPSDLAYTAMEAAYTYGDRWIDEVCGYLRGNAALVSEYAAEHLPRILVTRHEGTFLMWLDMTCFGRTSAELTDILSGDYGVALGNGRRYGPEAEGFMRLNIGCTRATLRQGLERLRQFYRDHIKE